MNGTDLTGLNGSALTSRINQAKQNRATGIVVDLGTVSHMTPAGMESPVLQQAPKASGPAILQLQIYPGNQLSLRKTEVRVCSIPTPLCRKLLPL